MKPLQPIRVPAQRMELFAVFVAIGGLFFTLPRLLGHVSALWIGPALMFWVIGIVYMVPTYIDLEPGAIRVRRWLLKGADGRIDVTGARFDVHGQSVVMVREQARTVVLDGIRSEQTARTVVEALQKHADVLE